MKLILRYELQLYQWVNSERKEITGEYVYVWVLVGQEKDMELGYEMEWSVGKGGWILRNSVPGFTNATLIFWELKSIPTTADWTIPQSNNIPNNALRNFIFTSEVCYGKQIVMFHRGIPESEVSNLGKIGQIEGPEDALIFGNPKPRFDIWWK